MISCHRNAAFIGYAWLNRRHVGVLPRRPVSGQKRSFEMEADRREFYILQQRSESLHLIAQQFHFAVADFGNGLKRSQRLLLNFVANRIELNSRRHGPLSERGDGCKSSQAQQEAPTHCRCLSHASKSVLSQSPAGIWSATLTITR